MNKNYIEYKTKLLLHYSRIRVSACKLYELTKMKHYETAIIYCGVVFFFYNLFLSPKEMGTLFQFSVIPFAANSSLTRSIYSRSGYPNLNEKRRI